MTQERTAESRLLRQWRQEGSTPVYCATCKVQEGVKREADGGVTWSCGQCGAVIAGEDIENEGSHASVSSQ